MPVTFDAASSAQETSGDGILSLTHTAGGADRAAFSTQGHSAAAGRTSSTTYDGVAMTEMWDFVHDLTEGNAGYRLAGVPAAAATVTNTLSGTASNHTLGVMSMTGVDQTTPVGTAESASSTGGQPSLTVTSVGADDLVVDGIFGAQATLTVGADQTTRYSEDIQSRKLRGSTQPGTAGGVMSWTVSDVNDPWGHGAVAFKPAAAAGATWPGWTWSKGGWS